MKSANISGHEYCESRDIDFSKCWSCDQRIRLD